MDVACALLPHLELRAACRGDEPAGRPVALAPEPGEANRLGQVSPAAAEQGVTVKMAIAEALARCPELVLVPPDPSRAADLWEGVLRRLEGIGAAVESERPGEAFFAVDGLRRLHGGTRGVIAAAHRAAGPEVRIAAAPTRFAAFVAAQPEHRRPHRDEPAIVSAGELRGFLGPLPVATLQTRLAAPGREARDLISTLQRLGIETLGRLASLPSDEVADRFGPLGQQALRLARGVDTPLRPRSFHEETAEEIELPEGAAGVQLDNAMALLTSRLLAAPSRRARTVLGLRLEAGLCGGGSWSASLILGRPTASAEALNPALARRLEALPGPAESLRLRVTAFGPPTADQLRLAAPGEEQRRGNLSRALQEIRATQGAEGLLKALPVDADSRVPERRAMLAPYQEP